MRRELSLLQSLPTSAATNMPAELVHEAVRFRFAVVDELERNRFHWQLKRTQVSNRFVPNLDLNRPVAVGRLPQAKGNSLRNSAWVHCISSLRTGFMFFSSSLVSGAPMRWLQRLLDTGGFRPVEPVAGTRPSAVVELRPPDSPQV